MITFKERKLKMIPIMVSETKTNNIEYGYYENMSCPYCASEGLWLDMENESMTHDNCYCEKCNTHFKLKVNN